MLWFANVSRSEFSNRKISRVVCPFLYCGNSTVEKSIFGAFGKVFAVFFVVAGFLPPTVALKPLFLGAVLLLIVNDGRLVA